MLLKLGSNYRLHNFLLNFLSYRYMLNCEFFLLSVVSKLLLVLLFERNFVLVIALVVNLLVLGGGVLLCGELGQLLTLVCAEGACLVASSVLVVD
jgi:hypothetical protein